MFNGDDWHVVMGEESAKRNGLPQAMRLRKAADFERVYNRRRSVSDANIIVYACENGLPHLRLGLSVSRKNGKAHQRNRLRRLYREAFRLSRHDMPAGLDLVIIPRRPAPPLLTDLMKSLPRLVTRLAARLAEERK
jgi:ribonuclease P protein component